MKSVIKFFDKIIVVLLGIFGVFNSCEQAEKYGMPYAKYELKGIVTDKETSNPIQNIQVVRHTYMEYGGDTLYTDVEGKYAFPNPSSHFYMDSDFHLKFEDIDGEENGGDFKSKEIKGRFTEADRVEKGEGKWYQGKFVRIANIELEKKNVFDTLYGVKSTTFKP